MDFIKSIKLFYVITSLVLVNAELFSYIESRSGNGPEIRYVVENSKNTPETFVIEATPFDSKKGEVRNNPFLVHNSQTGEPAQYFGIVAKSVPDRRNTLEVDGYSIRGVIVDISLSYFLDPNVEYIVSAKNPEVMNSEYTDEIIVITSEGSDSQIKNSATASLDPTQIEQNDVEQDCKPAGFIECSASEQNSINLSFVNSVNLIQGVPLYNDENPGDELTKFWFGGDGDDLCGVRHGYHNIEDLFCFAGNLAGGSIVDCRCEAYAGTTDYDNIFAYVYIYDQTHTINLCGVFWETGDLGIDSRMGTMVHEASHFIDVANTDDHAYGCSNCKNLANNNMNKARNNADNYGYYVEQECGSPTPPNFSELPMCDIQATCDVSRPHYIGDGWCDHDLSGYNTEVCGWDGGDCCPDTCVPADYECNSNGYDCRDPGLEVECTEAGGRFKGTDNRVGSAKTIEDCCAACADDSQCEHWGFKVSNSVCQNYYDAGVLTAFSGDWVHDELPSVPTEDGRWGGTGTQVYSAKLRSFEDCAHNCAHNNDCVNWAYRAVTSRCKHYSAGATTKGTSGWVRNVPNAKLSASDQRAGDLINTSTHEITSNDNAGDLNANTASADLENVGTSSVEGTSSDASSAGDLNAHVESSAGDLSNDNAPANVTSSVGTSDVRG